VGAQAAERLPFTSRARAAEALLLAAAIAQVVYLARWPLDLWTAPISFGLAAGVSVARAGVYTALAWGLRTGEPGVRSLAAIEFARSVLLFVLVFVIGQGGVGSALYPAPWCQGVLSAGLPLLVAINVALNRGWQPGAIASSQALVLAIALAVGAAMLADSLWGEEARRREADGRTRGYVRSVITGLPMLFGMSVLEGASVAAALLLPGL